MTSSEAWKKERGFKHSKYFLNRRYTNKIYYQKHKDEITAHRKERYQAKKDEINRRRRKRYGAKILKEKYRNLPEKEKGIEVWNKMVKEWHERYDY